jgi:hypothetical protein
MKSKRELNMTKKLKTKGGLPREAFAIVGDAENPDTWHLAHHNNSIVRASEGLLDIEQTVDWNRAVAAARALSPVYQGRVQASPEEILKAANHVAGHYRKGNRPLPDILAALA